MNKSRLLGAVYACLIAIVSSSAQATFLYDVNRIVGGATVTGQIETFIQGSGLSSSAIKSYDITISDGVASFQFLPSTTFEGNFIIDGNILSANDTGLFFDFTLSGRMELRTLCQFCSGPLDHGWGLFGQTARTFPQESVALGGVQRGFSRPPTALVLIATPTPSLVPIPAAVWLFGSGLLGLVGMARRKKAA
jgi:hypothetical protein